MLNRKSLRLKEDSSPIRLWLIQSEGQHLLVCKKESRTQIQYFFNPNEPIILQYYMPYRQCQKSRLINTSQRLKYCNKESG